MPPDPPRDFPYARVLVTGGAGFIGSALVWALNQRGVERIVVADRLGTDAKWRNLAPLAFEDYLEADDLLPRLERHALGRFDCVLHMGACSATTERRRHLPRAQQFRVYQAARRLGTRPRRTLRLRLERGHLWQRGRGDARLLRVG